ncbi:MAG TPA: enoyl-CoA hydratase/isomerase family protein, partial [Caldithrix sp.]|nr:enoyl-CoA hydratase/isomerase family protein [Caldithrix sp.]
CCDYIFAASETAKFGFTEVRIGFVPAIVMNFLIRKIAPGTALHLALSGKIFSAEEAKKLGLVEQVFPLNGLRDRTMDFIGTILQQNSFQAMMTTKALLQDLLEHPLNRGLEIASAVNAKSRQTHDCQQGLKAFLNKEKIEWRKF